MKKKYPVITPVEHDGKLVAPGKHLVLDEEVAEPLLAVKAIGEGEAVKDAVENGSAAKK